MKSFEELENSSSYQSSSNDFTTLLSLDVCITIIILNKTPIIFTAKFIIFNANFIIVDTEFINSNAEFINLNANRYRLSWPSSPKSSITIGACARQNRTESLGKQPQNSRKTAAKQPQNSRKILAKQ